MLQFPSRSTRLRPSWRIAAGSLGLAAATALAACGSAAASGSSPDASPSATSVSGTANVAYAGSLQALMEETVGPAFASATGASYQGQGGGSDAVSQEIASGEITPNVFLSVGPSPITELEPKFTSWYAQLASSPIVVAYSPKGTYGAQLTKIAKGKLPKADLFKLMAKPNFVLGRTDPNTDPQGQAFYEMVQAAQKYYHLPKGTAKKILGPLDNPKQAFEEESLESYLQSGQLDASSSYQSVAIQDHLHYIKLPDALNFGNPKDSKVYHGYTIKLDDGTKVHGVLTAVDATTIGTTDSQAATAFVTYLLSKPGRADFKKAGYTLLTPTVIGKNAPKQVTSAVKNAAKG